MPSLCSPQRRLRLCTPLLCRRCPEGVTRASPHDEESRVQQVPVDAFKVLPHGCPRSGHVSRPHRLKHRPMLGQVTVQPLSLMTADNIEAIEELLALEVPEGSD